jgi:hypothetical protein
MARNAIAGLRVKHAALLLTFEADAPRSSPAMTAKSRNDYEEDERLPREFISGTGRISLCTGSLFSAPFPPEP